MLKRILASLAAKLFRIPETPTRKVVHRGFFMLAMLLGVSNVQAGVFCTDPVFYNAALNKYIVDGSNQAIVDYFAANNITQITIDTDCVFANWDPLKVTLNFQTNDPSVYLIVFDNVIYEGNMACANINHKIWFTNGSFQKASKACQDITIPSEYIDKAVPAGKATVGIGETFTYSLTMPYIDPGVWGGDPSPPTNYSSPNDLYNVILYDNVSAAATGIGGATGAELSIVSIEAYKNGNKGDPVIWTNDGQTAALCNDANNSKELCFKLTPLLASRDQINVDITVLVENAPVNINGTQFANTAKWWFGREIDIDDDSSTPPELFTPLPGEWGISPVLTIAEPSLVVNKSASETVVNVASQVDYTIDVQNQGGSSAFSATIVDNLPDTPTPGDGGMCNANPINDFPGNPVVVAIYQSGATTPSRTLVAGTDYTVTYNDASGTPACQLKVVLDSNSTDAVIGPTERLVINYRSQVDDISEGLTDGFDLINVAGVSEWYSGNDVATRKQFTGTVSNGTVGTDDEQDAYPVKVSLSGYYFQKTADNLTSGQTNATFAGAGDTLHYKVRVFNVDTAENILDFTLTDKLDTSKLDISTLTNVSVSGAYTTGTITYDVVGGDTLTIPASTDTAIYNINASQELQVEFDINLLPGLADGTTISNQAHLLSADASYDVDTDDPNKDGVVNYGDPKPWTVNPTVVTVLAPGALVKTTEPAVTQAVIGDTITYKIVVPKDPVNLPIYDVRVKDDMTFAAINADLNFISATAALVSGTNFSVSNSGTTSNIDIGDSITGVDIPAGDQAVFYITVQVANTLKNQASGIFQNSASYTYNRVDGATSTEASGPSAIDGSDTSNPISILEPAVTSVTKAVDNAAPNPGDTVTYTVDIVTSNAPGTSDLFDVTITDTLDLGLAYVPGSAAIGGTPIADPAVYGDGVSTAESLFWSTTEIDLDIPAGNTVSLTYQVKVLNNVLALQTLNNSVEVQWTSVNGAVAGERNGSDGPPGVDVLNDYAYAPQSSSVTTPDINASISKTLNYRSWATGTNEVRIGDIVEYALTIPIPRGTLGNVVIVDSLPQGLKFEEIASINGSTGTAGVFSANNNPFSHADISVGGNVVVSGDPTTAAGSSVTWTLGNITNLPVAGDPENFTIIYRARVLDNVFSQTNSTNIINSVSLAFDKYGPTTVNSNDSASIVLKQPNLSVSKSASTGGGDVVVAPGETITYTVDIANDGSVPAYDVVLQDTIPAGLRGAGITMQSAALLVAGTNYVPPPNPTFDALTGVAIWDLNTGIANAYSIPVNDILRIVYRVSADAAIGGGLTLTNAAVVTDYYSFDDNATPTRGGVTGVRQHYGPTNTATSTVYTGALPSKSLTSPVTAEATIGEEIVYTILVPGTPSQADLYDIQITDVLNSNLELVSYTVTGATATDTNTPSQLNLAITSIPATQQASIEVHARIKNVTGAQQGIAINNTVTYSYAYAPADPFRPSLTSTDVVTVNIVEPTLSVVKSADDTTPVAGQTIRYSVALTDSSLAGSADAFDISLTDNLDLGLVYVGNVQVTSGAYTNSISDAVVSGDGTSTAQTLSWSLANGNANIDVAKGETIIVSYDVMVDNSVLAGQALNNSVVARWTGIDGSSLYERNGSDGIGNLNDYVTAPYVLTVTTPSINATIDKQQTGDSYTGSGNVRIGDIVEYTLTISLPEGSVGNLQVVDTLPKGLQFASVKSIDGATGAPYTSTLPLSFNPIPAGNIVASGDATAGTSSVTWSIGDVNNQPQDGNPNNLVIVYHARVLDQVFTQSVLPIDLNNTVQVSYDTATGTTNNSDIDTHINVIQPSLSVTKSALANGGDAVIEANELVTYTVAVQNSGMAPAYDPVIQDTLPLGMRNGTITMVSAQLLVAGTNFVPQPTPSYDSNTGIITWNLDTGTANSYTIPANDTLQIVYQVSADANLSAGMTLTNSVIAANYYSFDNNAVPALDADSGVREVYGPSVAASTTLTTAAAGALQKDRPVNTSVSIGETFSYTITVPAVAQNVQLNDVRILDDLSAFSADVSFVSAQKLSGSQTWTPVNTGTSTNLVIEDTVNGIDIPAGEQVQIEITVVVEDTANNVDGTLFDNQATYTYNQSNNDNTTQQNGMPGNSGNMMIVEPLNMTLEKTGPANVQVGVAAGYTLNIHNTGNATAYDATIVDYLPNPIPGGMCDTTQPGNFGAQLYLGDMSATFGPVLVENTDFSVTFTNSSPTCSLSFTMLSAAAAIPKDYRLVITYGAYLDDDTPNATALTNIAGVTQWFSGDTAGAGATGSIRTYTKTITDGTTTVLDHEDAYTSTSQAPQITFEKYVTNVTTNTTPGTTASPGDVLHYVITATNTSTIPAPNFSITDDLDALNTPAAFVAGTLNVTNNGGGTDNSVATGGSKGTGYVNISGLSLDASGSDSVTIEFDITLAAVIDSGTNVLNQAQLQLYSLPAQLSDDPNTAAALDPTATVINSAPQFLVQKTSADLTGSSSVLLPGETLRYTITVQNIGDEDAVNAMLRDSIPANTTYVAGSTRLNGVAVADPATGVSALAAGMAINAPSDPVSGHMPAGPSTATNNIATITFDVTVNSDALNGTIISNQAYFNADGAGNSGAIPEQPSDDPNTTVANDPTRNVVGSVPLLDATKTVALYTDLGTPGYVDPGDTLEYTIIVTNYGGVPASGVTFTDTVPANTTYVQDTTFLNTLPVGQPDNGTSPLIAGIPISSSDLMPPLPSVGYLSPGASATITFRVTVDAAVAPGTIIRNQGFVASNEQATEPTDVDGLDSNGDQATTIVVGNTQQLSINKSVNVVGGGAALPGSQLEYVIDVTNISSVPVVGIIVNDDYDSPVAGQKTYVANSATLNGLTAGTSISPPSTVVADYSANTLAPGESIQVRFKVTLDPGLLPGTKIDNTAIVYWNAMTQSASASVSIDVGAIPGVANLNGRIWHDANFDNNFDSGTEKQLENWRVEVYFKNALLGTVLSDSLGEYHIYSLAPNYLSTDRYELKFYPPGATASSAKLGMADSTVFSNDLQRIYDIVVYPNNNLQNLNLPIDPDGVVYNSIVRTPVPGASLTMRLASDNSVLPGTCFDDPNQQNQVTAVDGYYKFDLNFSDNIACPSGMDYLIEVAPPASGFEPGESVAIPATTNAGTAAFVVPGCAADAIAATSECEAQASEFQPPLSVAAGSAATNYYLRVNLASTQTPFERQLFNNHIPIDPELTNALAIRKTAGKLNVSRADFVPYTIVVSNTLPVALTNASVIDTMPAGFKYVKGSATLNGVAVEPQQSGLQLAWNVASIGVNETYTIKLLMLVGGGVQEGEYVNRAQVQSLALNRSLSTEASAAVRVVPDPTFDCSDLIGKVYDDRNRNGYPDDNEPGISGVRLVTARGLTVITDKHGRYHITCAAVPNEVRGSQFILKLDDRSLPSGYRTTSENPRVQKLTRGKAGEINFGATIHHVVTLSVGDGAFKPDSEQLRPQWQSRLGIALEQLRKQQSVLRISYLADTESASVVHKRIASLSRDLQEHWRSLSQEPLVIEKEIFWRHGGPVDKDPGELNINSYIDSILDRSDIAKDSERQLPHGYVYTPWMQDPSQFKHELEPTFETKQVKQKRFTTKKLKDVVPPILFKSGKADIPQEVVEKLRKVLNNMRDRVHVRLHFVGHTDNVKLRGKLKEKYQDNAGLSKERAGTTAEFFQAALELPPEAISYDGKGDSEPVASNDKEAGRRLNRRVEVQVWYDEVSEDTVEQKVEVEQKSQRIMVCRVETMCKLRYKAGHSRRAKLRNLVPPFNYDETISEVPPDYLHKLRQALQNLSNKDNVQMHFVGHTDNIPLTGRDERIYGDHIGISKAHARRLAIAVQEALGLPNKAVASSGKGSAFPVASNNSERGRTLNRRIEVEFWHDDPLEDLPDEPQICPEAAAAETIERVYNPPEGDIKPIFFDKGKPDVQDNYYMPLRRAMDDIKDKGKVRLRFIGYTSNKRLDRRTAQVYGDDVGLSTARARRAMEFVKQKMNLRDDQVEYEGRGYVQSKDVVNTGFLELDKSKVEVQVIYDDLAVLDESEGVSINRITRDVATRNPFALNLMRISVDGQPLNDPNKSIPDVQRCTDVALDQTELELKFDNLKLKPRLNVTAWPNVIAVTDDDETRPVENLSHFRMYSNYPHLISKAEVRLFAVDQSSRDTPLAIVPLDQTGNGSWQYDKNSNSLLPDYQPPRVALDYILRVYDKDGHYDETSRQTLWLVDHLETPLNLEEMEKSLRVGYGENRQTLNHIPINGGTVSLHGHKVPDGHQAVFAGQLLPISDKGEFAGEFILPNGLHKVEVAIVDKDGNGQVFQRKLSLDRSDWFYVGIADITVGRDVTNGAASQVTQDSTHYDNGYSFDSRFAFYVKGKFANDNQLTASVDTLESPVDEMFSNFLKKDPRSLFRRIDPDYYYPSYGDDSTLEQGAPTSGKFYVKLQKNQNYGMWGNFNISYLDNSLAHVDRGLYGANINYESAKVTGFGARRWAANLYAAEPGTVAGRDEFLGTGGSLYFLRHQDILAGSDRLRIEVRDRISGQVVSVRSLTHGLDYDIDYIQGRVVLSEPLSASAGADGVVDSGDFGGRDVYLVSRYEYTPGFDDLNDINTGGRAHYWINDNVKVGLTEERQNSSGSQISLSALDVTYRLSAHTWFKLEQSVSRGPVSSSSLSSDGGYQFFDSSLDPNASVRAKGWRTEGSVALSEINDTWKGRFNFFNQQLDAGYNAPGLLAGSATTQRGFKAEVPVLPGLDVKLGSEQKIQKNALDSRALELDAKYKLNSNWSLASGIRLENRKDNSLNVAATQQQGERTDLTFRADYDSQAKWSAFGYAQGTAKVRGNRDSNDRLGLGGAYRLTDRFKLDGELSAGDLGSGAKFGADYKLSETSNVYSHYVLENERSDNGVKAHKGSLASGYKTRYSDSASIYMEERYTHGDTPSGITHSFGFELAYSDKLNIGGKLDVGTLKDNNTGAETDRKAAGVKFAYKFENFSLSSLWEFRRDRNQQPDLSFARRNTWLTKNGLAYKLNPNWRFIGKLNYSQSVSTLGNYYNGDYTELVAGYAYRPLFGKWQHLFKYTYFYNLPTADQLTPANDSVAFIQRSHVLSLDSNYRLSRHWSLGGKYAYRLGQVAMDRENPQFFDSNASLYIVRADWYVSKRWDFLYEARVLDLPDAGDRRSGILVGVYRHINRHFKIGAGYNFSDFSDDLTDLDYDSQGVFINLVGKI